MLLPLSLSLSLCKATLSICKATLSRSPPLSLSVKRLSPALPLSLSVKRISYALSIFKALAHSDVPLLALCGRADYRRIGVAKKRFWTDGKPQEVAWADHAFQARCSSAQSAPVLAARRGEVIDVARALARLAVSKASEGGGSVTESSTAPVLSDRDGEEGGVGAWGEDDMDAGAGPGGDASQDDLGARVADVMIKMQEGKSQITTEKVKAGSGRRFQNDLEANGRIQMSFLGADFAECETVQECARLAGEHRKNAREVPLDPDHVEGYDPDDPDPEVYRPHLYVRSGITTDGKPAFNAVSAIAYLFHFDDAFFVTGSWHLAKAALTQNNRLFGDIFLAALVKAYGRDTLGRVRARTLSLSLSLKLLFLSLPLSLCVKRLAFSFSLSLSLSLSM